MSAFLDAVRETNRRLKEDGWRTWPAPPELACVNCKKTGETFLTTIYGTTRATCACGATWELG